MLAHTYKTKKRSKFISKKYLALLSKIIMQIKALPQSWHCHDLVATFVIIFTLYISCIFLFRSQNTEHFSYPDRWIAGVDRDGTLERIKKLLKFRKHKFFINGKLSNPPFAYTMLARERAHVFNVSGGKFCSSKL